MDQDMIEVASNEVDKQISKTKKVIFKIYETKYCSYCQTALDEQGKCQFPECPNFKP
jgi:thioredoxin-related protein